MKTAILAPLFGLSLSSLALVLATKDLLSSESRHTVIVTLLIVASAIISIVSLN
jgi:hypothetical protein